jgi:hypothetical protein
VTSGGRVLGGLLLLGGAVASAGPREARDRWREAEAARDAPWRERVVSYRAVRREAGEGDPMRARALVAEAKVLREADEHAAAQAAEAVAAALGPARDPDRLARALAAARALHSEGDDAGAATDAADVVEHGSASPALASASLLLLARIASTARDVDAVDALARRAERDLPGSVVDRLEILDLLGTLALALDDEPRARRALADQKRVFASARRGGDALERSAAKAWLRLSLPRLLE